MRVALVTSAVVAALLAPGAAVAAPESAQSSTISEQRARTLAKAGILTKADLKGYEAAATEPSAGDIKEEKAFHACLGKAAPKHLARNPGFTYAKDGLAIDSSADVFGPVSAATADVKALASAKAPACFKQRMAALFKRYEFTVHELKVTRAAVTVANSDAAAALKVTAMVQETDIMYYFTSYLVAARVGQTKIIVSPRRFDDYPLSLKKAAALAGVAAGRVRAA
jgi:hypothetical protein